MGVDGVISYTHSRVRRCREREGWTIFPSIGKEEKGGYREGGGGGGEGGGCSSESVAEAPSKPRRGMKNKSEGDWVNCKTRLSVFLS